MTGLNKVVGGLVFKNARTTESQMIEQQTCLNDDDVQSLIEHLTISCYVIDVAKMTNWPTITFRMIYTLIQQDDRIVDENQIP